MNPKRFLKLILFFSVSALVLLACELGSNNEATSEPQSTEDLSTAIAAGIQGTQTAEAALSGDSPTATEESSSESPTDTPEPTEEEKSTTVSVTVNTNCRSGPGVEFDNMGAVLIGEIAEVVGVPPAGTNYLIIKNLDGPGNCWLWLQYANVEGDLSGFPIVVIPPTPTPSPGSITGIVWDDKCSSGAPGSPPPGCLNPAPYGANGILDAGEVGFSGVYVELGVGACPSIGYANTTTDPDGNYIFINVSPGDYCVTIYALHATNVPILIPGGWSYPNSDGWITVTVGSGENVISINFGWDFQFD